VLGIGQCHTTDLKLFRPILHTAFLLSIIQNTARADVLNKLDRPVLITKQVT